MPSTTGFLFLLLVGYAVTAQTAQATVNFAAPTGAFACSSDLHCGLNGKCNVTTKACDCDAAWMGPACGRMNLLPAAAATLGGAYGVTPNVTSWGGNILSLNGTYYLFVTEMAGGCGLEQWQHDSQIILATSATPQGPFQRQRTLLLPEAHNAQVVQVPPAAAAGAHGAAFALFHIGTGDNSSQRTPCDEPYETANRSHASSASQIETASPNGGQVLHVSPTPEGPWTSLPLGISCNNPAPMAHPNGTWYLICNGGGFVLYRAEMLSGPWKAITTLPRSPAGTGTWEDPFLYRDARDRWHVLAHSWNHTDDGAISGHYYSLDGLTWQTTGEQPYGNTAALDDGRTLHFRTRERPKLMFDTETNAPLYLLNGVNTNMACGSPASSCKTRLGFDWDYTFIQPVAQGEA